MFLIENGSKAILYTGDVRGTLHTWKNPFNDRHVFQCS